MPSLSVEDYYIGWICALSKEMTAALAMLDEEHPILEGQQQHDNNNYALGRIHSHNVVIACMPAGADGLVNAANVARDMARTFPALRVCLMVGIGGGIPNLEKGIDIRLGDIVVSQPDGTWGGVVQYDKKKAEDGGKFVMKGQLNQPPPVLLQTLARLKAEHDRRDSWIPRYMKEAIERNSRMSKTGYIFPANPDRLYCAECDRDSEVPNVDCASHHGRRQERSDNTPAVHYGIVASANQVVKDARVRDDLRDRFAALCVEMEAAGLMNHFPCLVIRGICDYADAHKNDVWHPYAAMTAAAYTKEFLYYVSPTKASHEKPIQQVIDVLGELSQNSVAQLAVSEEHLQVTKGHFEQSQNRYESDKHAQCHQTLKTSSYEDHKDVNPRRVAGTCQWVLNHPKYRDWYDSLRDDLLWISADPGCGKSVLAKSLIENELQSTDTHTVCYFFFKDNEQQDGVATALCAMLHQLFSHNRQLIRHAIPAWEKDGSKLSGEVSGLWRIWLAAARDSEAHHVTCVLDALDECREAERNKIIGLLTDFYRQTLTSPIIRQGRLKFLVTSRPYDDIHRGFSAIPADLPTIQLRGEDENDKISKEINLVVQARIAQLAAELKLEFHTKQQLEKSLLEMKHRTYLWLHLAVDDIYHTFRKSLRRDQQSINFIPSTVEQAYEKILGRIGKDEESTVKQILQIVVGARRPLTINEMAIALGIATSTDVGSLAAAKVDHKGLGNRIRDWCGLFIFINHFKIYLIHQTAKEFLICDNGFNASTSGWKHCLDRANVEKQLSRICVEFLCLKDIQPTTRLLNDGIKRLGQRETLDTLLDEGNEVESFAVYSTEYWHSHVRSSSLTIQDSLFSKVLQLYNTSSDLHSQWFNIYWKIFRFWERRPQMNNLQLAAFLGHDQILRLILDQQSHPNINLADSSGTTALGWASEFSYLEVVKVLLDKDADVNAQGGQYGNALQAASLEGHLEVVNVLLDKDADVNARGGEYGNALQAASLGGHLEVVKVLLNKDADVNARGGQYGNALQAASLGGHLEVVKVLLNKDADVNAQGGQYGNALQAASLEGHLEVVNVLLDKDADVNARGGGYGNALQVASLGGHLEVVKVLLDKDADVNAQGGYYGNALLAALMGSHSQVALLLVNAGAYLEPHQQLDYMQEALRKDDPQLLREFLKFGWDINQQDAFHRTLLHKAVYSGKAQSVEFLINYGADLTLTDGYGQTAVYWASLNPDLLELFNLHLTDYVPISKATQFRSLKESIYKLSVSLLGASDPNSQPGFHQLGHCLIFLQELEKAQFAFQQTVLEISDTGVAIHDTYCDMCRGGDIIIQGSRFVCKTCPDVDLCDSCMQKYPPANDLFACRNHAFLEVNGSLLGSSTANGYNRSAAWRGGPPEGVRGWLENLIDVYQSPLLLARKGERILSA